MVDGFVRRGLDQSLVLVTVVGLSCRTASSASVTGDEITYPPLAHLPRSIRRQRSLQKGKSGSVAFVGFLQIGQRSLMERFAWHSRLQRSEVRLQR